MLIVSLSQSVFSIEVPGGVTCVAATEANVCVGTGRHACSDERGCCYCVARVVVIVATRQSLLYSCERAFNAFTVVAQCGA